MGVEVVSCEFCCRYVRSHLLSSDYEGCVTLWDVDTGLAVNEYEAHDKRIWSVDFCTADSSLFVSGSDDGWIKAGPCLILYLLTPLVMNYDEGQACSYCPGCMPLMHPVVLPTFCCPSYLATSVQVTCVHEESYKESCRASE